ncbi:DNA repair protein Rad33p [[Candida] railenensis]|uniref:DNA repair protein Rad33p n=1 Tax=[Candida] railenensis TaxID=45579 RepID=A0A9P0QX09_9ASCO|nr:DNA repair protein Rad33p [[Candida] railenensis]
MSKKGFHKSSQFELVPEYIENEIIQLYKSLNDSDLFFSDLPNFFKRLGIEEIFIKDIINCVEYFYNQIYSKDDVDLNVAENAKQYITLKAVKSFTITQSIDNLDDIIDVIDVQKLIKNSGKLIKLRDNFELIVDSWSLFVKAGDQSNKNIGKDEILNYRLTLPHLQKIKQELGLEESLSDSSLIDMLGSCATSGDDIVNYDWDKLKEGKYVNIRDFAEIMGQLGEFD